MKTKTYLIPTKYLNLVLENNPCGLEENEIVKWQEFTKDEFGKTKGFFFLSEDAEEQFAKIHSLVGYDTPGQRCVTVTYCQIEE